MKLREVQIKKDEKEISLEAALAWARENIPGAWLLAESPAKVIFEPFGEAINAADLADCTQIAVFGELAEIRLEKAAGKSLARMLWESESGEAMLRRESEALLAGGGKLLFCEYFQEGESGFPAKMFDRLRGVAKGAR